MARGNIVKTGDDDGTITLADGAVTTNKIFNNAVTADKLASGAVTEDKLADSAKPHFYLDDNGKLTMTPFYGLAGANVPIAQFFSQTFKDTEARDWIDNHIIVSSDKPPTAIDVDMPKGYKIGTVYIQTETDFASGTEAKYIYVYSGETPISYIWRQIYPVPFYASNTGGMMINKSGLAYNREGMLYVNTKENGGTKRTGAGEVVINPATQEEVMTGTEIYKPVTPATLAAFKTANKIDAWADAFAPGSRMYDVLGYASLTEMAEDLKPLHKYSTTPQQIGAWIDGTPVWRVAFNTPLSAQDLEDKAFWTISALGLVNDLDAVTLILDGTAALYMESIVDNQTTSLDANGVFTWSNSVNPDANAIAGYIEFVTPASNIRS